MRHKEFWFALTVGALAGAIAALLYAPQSGASTRRKIRRGIEDIGDSLEDSAEYLKAQAERLSKEAQRLLDYSKSQFDSGAEQAANVGSFGSKAAKVASRLV